MPLRPWVGTEPVQVRPDIPKDAFEQKRISLTGAWALNTLRTMRPPDGYYWLVDSIQMEYVASIVEGTRDLYYYVYDKTDNAMRCRIVRLAKTQTAWMIGTPGCTYNGTDAATGTGSFQLYTVLLDFQMYFGFLVSNFYDTGDIFNVHMFVREYKIV